MENKELKKIGYFVKSLRVKQGLTQKDFAKLLNTTQSNIARMESGKQNLTTNELFKISKVLNQRFISLKNTIDLKITGGSKLSGSIDTNTSKNGALHLIFASLINSGTTTLKDVPRIEEVFRVIEILKSIKVKIRWVSNRDLEITPPSKYSLSTIDREAAVKIRSILMIIGSLVHASNSFSIPHSGGCKMGERTIGAHKYGFEDLGYDIETKESVYKISKSKRKRNKEIIMYEASDTAATNLIIAASRIPQETVIKFIPSNYMVQDVCHFMTRLGVKIEGIGTSTLKITGKENIKENVEVYVGEDPIESMLFITAAIITESKLQINKCPIDFLDLELFKLKKMNLKFKKSKVYISKNGSTKLVDITVYPSKLIAPKDKIHALPYPGINIDNLPFFVPIATQCEGETLIHDWLWENRAIYFTELNKLGAQINLADPHRVFITGKTKLHKAQVICPPALRPAVIVLISMLAAEGESILRNIYSISRGYEDIARRLNGIGAKIEIINGF